MNQTLLFQSYDNIINILENKEYCLNSAAVNRLKALRETTVYTVDNLPNSLMVTDIEGHNTTQYNTAIFSRPQVIDPEPLLFEGKLIAFKPVIILPSARCKGIMNLWNTISQICRLFSIGSYHQAEDGIITHSFGLNQYSYRTSPWRNKLEIISQKEYPIKNAILNNAVTWHFVEKLTDKKQKIPDQYVTSESRSLKERVGFEKSIGMYFSGNVDNIVILSNRVFY